MNKKSILLIIILFLLSFGCIFTVSKFNGLRLLRPPMSHRDTRNDNVVVNVIPSPTLVPTTSEPPTPTPTLTKEQIAENRKKLFEEYNQKYGPCRWVPVLMYHHIMPDDQAKAIGAGKLNVNPEAFRRQMDYLLGKGYQIIGLDEMMTGLKNSSLPSKPVVLTFDDAYRDFFDFVFPILKEKNIKATVFVISQFVGGDRYVTWDELGELNSSNLVLIGDHTLSHLSLINQPVEKINDQIISAKNILESRLGKPVKYFAYPYGNVGQSKQTLRDGGFEGAVLTTNTNPQCAGLPYVLSRIRIGAASLANWGL
jgi:peptidoglycan/xylan/chitin deacetylase (PgdA/CDA1 family)